MADVNVWNKKNITYNSLLPHYPITSFLRLIFTETKKYSDNLKKINSKTKVLDIGTYYLNNLLRRGEHAHTLSILVFQCAL